MATKKKSAKPVGKKVIPKKKPVKKKSAKPVGKPAPITAAEKSMTADEKRRADWEVNNELISEAFFTSILKHKKFPTYKKLAEDLGLDVKTVQRHLADDEMFSDLKIKMRALTGKALLTLGIKAMQGSSHHWSRLFFEVMDEVKEKDKGPVIMPTQLTDNQFDKLLKAARESKANTGK